MKVLYRPLVLGCAMLMAMAVAPSIHACGDKLVGLGGGVPFARIHPEHYVGQIVLFARRNSDLQSFEQQGHFTHQLERSGHTVRLIDNESDLEGALRGKPTDVILAAPADAQMLRARLTRSAGTPLVLAMVTTPATRARPELSVAECSVQVSGEQSKSVMRTVEDFISRRQAGAAVNCAGTAERS